MTTRSGRGYNKNSNLKKSTKKNEREDEDPATDGEDKEAERERVKSRLAEQKLTLKKRRACCRRKPTTAEGPATQSITLADRSGSPRPRRPGADHVGQTAYRVGGLDDMKPGHDSAVSQTLQNQSDDTTACNTMEPKTQRTITQHMIEADRHSRILSMRHSSLSSHNIEAQLNERVPVLQLANAQRLEATCSDVKQNTEMRHSHRLEKLRFRQIGLARQARDSNALQKDTILKKDKRSDTHSTRQMWRIRNTDREETRSAIMQSGIECAPSANNAFGEEGDVGRDTPS